MAVMASWMLCARLGGQERERRNVSGVMVVEELGDDGGKEEVEGTYL